MMYTLHEIYSGEGDTEINRDITTYFTTYLLYLATCPLVTVIREINRGKHTGRGKEKESES